MTALSLCKDRVNIVQEQNTAGYFRGFRKASDTLEKFKSVYFKTNVEATDTSDLIDDED